MISIIAIQNWGAAMPKMAKALQTRSSIVSRFTAEMMPSGTPTPMASSIPASARCTVAGMRSHRISCTGRRSVKELPKSSRTALIRKFQYWMMNGLSSPSAAFCFSYTVSS